MKKNLILGVLAVISAAGSAFATFAPESAYIWAKTSTTQTNFTCQPCGVSCDNIGTMACQVRVTLTSGETKTVSGRRYNGGQCTPVLIDSMPPKICTNSYAAVM